MVIDRRIGSSFLCGSALFGSTQWLGVFDVCCLGDFITLVSAFLPEFYENRGQKLCKYMAKQARRHVDWFSAAHRTCMVHFRTTTVVDVVQINSGTSCILKWCISAWYGFMPGIWFHMTPDACNTYMLQIRHGTVPNGIVCVIQVHR